MIDIEKTSPPVNAGEREAVMAETWLGWDPETYTPPECPSCEAPLTINWIERTPIGGPRSWMPGRIECPSSRFHDIDSAGRLVVPVDIYHEEHGAGRCPLSELDEWRGRGWYPLAPELQTTTEMVERRVAELL